MTLWRAHLAYSCRKCREDCINKVTEEQTRYQECAKCHAVPTLDPINHAGKPVDQILPSLRWATIAALTTFELPARSTASEERSGRDPHTGPAASTTAPEADRREAENGRGKPEWRLNGTLAPDGGAPVTDDDPR